MSAPLPLWSAAEAAAATAGAPLDEWVAHGVSIDSRTLVAGDLFVALEGPNTDGHRHVVEALDRGAAAAVVSRRPGALRRGAPLLLVDDTMRALNALGGAARARSSASIIAVTGSVGKTGTKEALKLALGRQGPTHASVASYNNQWGVPVSLARMPRDARYGVFELGMNHPGELGPLARLVRPHVALITTVEAVHLAHFGSIEAIAKAKAEIFEGLEPGGTAILNRDNPHYERLARAAAAHGAGRTFGFGAGPEAWARLIKAAHQADMSCISADIGGQAIVFKVGVPGRHWVMNSIAVLAAVVALGADLGLAGMALAGMAAPEGRGRRHRIAIGGGSFELIDESYNASPVAVRAAFATLAAAETGRQGRRIAVLGDMLELGPEAARLHAALAKDLVAVGIDLAFTAGPDMAHLAAGLPAPVRAGHVDTAAALAPLVVGQVRPGDVVMVKGSLASRMREVVDALLRLDAPPPMAANG